jgi:hypothetical protein
VREHQADGRARLEQKDLTLAGRVSSSNTDNALVLRTRDAREVQFSRTGGSY